LIQAYALASEHLIRVSLEDFLRTGIFGPVTFGMAADEILAALGAPDTVFTRRRSRRPTGFEYGDVEFYLADADDARLCTIYLDHFDIPKGVGRSGSTRGCSGGQCLGRRRRRR
jgi:hypothetical protein